MLLVLPPAGGMPNRKELELELTGQERQQRELKRTKPSTTSKFDVSVAEVEFYDAVFCVSNHERNRGL